MSSQREQTDQLDEHAQDGRCRSEGPQMGTCEEEMWEELRARTTTPCPTLFLSGLAHSAKKNRIGLRKLPRLSFKGTCEATIGHHSVKPHSRNSGHRDNCYRLTLFLRRSELLGSWSGAVPDNSIKRK